LGALLANRIVARVAGDKLATLLWHVSVSNAIAKARSIERILATTEIPGAKGASIGASAVVAMLGASDLPDHVIASADAEMYLRKSEQRAAQKIPESWRLRITSPRERSHNSKYVARN
jgi:GGDEF domain-containing protein